MTDETKSETTSPARDGGTSAAGGKDDSLDSWFRPRVEQRERGQNAESDGASADAEQPDAAAAETPEAKVTDSGDKSDQSDKAVDGEEAEAKEVDRAAPAVPPGEETQVIAAAPAESATGPVAADNDRTQVFPVTPPAPANPAAAAPTEAIPMATAPSPSRPSDSDMAVRPATPRTPDSFGSAGDAAGDESWSPVPGPQPQYQEAPSQQRQEPQRPEPYQPAQARQRTQAYEVSGARPSILPPRGHDDYDDFDNYGFVDADRRPPSRVRRVLLSTGLVLVLALAVVAALAFSGKIKVLGIGAKPVPTVGFSPSGSDSGSYATQTGTAFLTDWENGNLKAAANITDDPSTALTQLTAYKNDLKLSGLTVMPGSASGQGWMTFNVTAQVGKPSSAWSYSSGLATYSSSIDGYTRWFVKWQPNLLFTSLKSGQKLALGLIPPTADKVVDRNGNEITSANAPSLNGIVNTLKKSAPITGGTPGQQVQIDNADGSVASKVAKLSDPVSTGSLKTTIDLKVQSAAQSAVNQAANSSMVVIEPSTGNVLAVANNPPNGLDTAMLGRYAPGSTFKTITTTLVLNKGVISNLNQTWDCPATLNVDGITLHNSEQESGVGQPFIWDFAQSCNNAFSRFGSEGKVTRDELASTAHDYFGFNQKWDVGLNSPTTYGVVPNTSSNSLAEELVGQDQITTSPLAMASVAATIANGSFKQPILVPGTSQITATPIPATTDQNLKTLMHQVVVSGTLAGVLPQDGVYAKTGTAEVQGKKPNSWTVAFRGDYAVAALAVSGGFGAATAGPEVNTLLNAVH